MTRKYFQLNPWVLLFVLMGLAVIFQGSRGLYSPDEGYYVCIGKTMAQSGDYLVPRLYQDIWLDKPPMTLWGIAAGLKLIGQNEWGARAFHSLCFVLVTLLTFLLGASLKDKRRGIIAAILFATMLLPFAAESVVTPDLPLVVWTTAAFLFFWKSVEPGAKRVPMWKLLMCAAFGLGFLTKGPAALVPAGALFVFLLFRRQAWRYFGTIWALPGLLIFAVLGLGWYALISHTVPGSLHYFWDNQVLGRTISDKYMRNPGLKGMLMYIPVILLGAFPWSLLWFSNIRERSRKIFQRETWRSIGADPARLFLALWIVVPFLIYLFAKSRLPLYPLPIFPALALGTAGLIPETAAKPGNRNHAIRLSGGMTIMLILSIIFLVGLKFTMSRIPTRKDMRALSRAIENHLPSEPLEIVSVNDHIEGVGFYNNTFIEHNTTAETPYPFFVMSEHLREEISELQTSEKAHIFVCRGEECEMRIRLRLQAQEIPFEEVSLPFHRHLFFTEKQKKDSITATPAPENRKDEAENGK